MGEAEGSHRRTGGKIEMKQAFPPKSLQIPGNIYVRYKPLQIAAIPLLIC
jgi:hypothetical protein